MMVQPEYRLGRLREGHPNISLHAFTATATSVQRDILVELGLRDRLAGRFVRPAEPVMQSLTRSNLRSCCRSRVTRTGIVYAVSVKWTRSRNG